MDETARAALERPDKLPRDMNSNIFLSFAKSASEHRQRTAFLFEGRSATYGAVLEQSLKIAAILRSLGMVAGQRVLAYSTNAPEYFSIFMGCAHAGCVLAPVNVAFRRRELHHIAANAQPAIAFVHVSMLGEFAAAMADCPHAPATVVAINGGASDAPPGTSGTLAATQPAQPAVAARDCAKDTHCLIVYTSGTTSAPKGVLHGHGSVGYAIDTYRDVWEYRVDDIAVVSTPMSWVSGLILTSAALLSAGATVCLLERFHPERVVEAIERHRATMFFGTMSMYTKILDVLQRRPADLSSLRFCMNGGEPCPEGAVLAAESRLGLRLCQAWALSENHPMVMSRPGEDTPRGAAGRPAPGAEIRLVGPDGRDGGVGTPGEAWVRGPGAMLGYHGDPALTAEKMDADGWIRTGDLLERDERGYLSVVGRASDMIIRSGANVAPAEVEAALLEHPAVRGACVVGARDVVSGESIVAFVVTAEGAETSAAEILDHLRSRLAGYKVPQEIVFRDQLPLNSNDKVDRNALKEAAVNLLAGRLWARVVKPAVHGKERAAR